MKEVKSVRIYKEDLADMVEAYGSLQKAVDSFCESHKKIKASLELKKMSETSRTDVVNHIIAGMDLADAIQTVLWREEARRRRS